MFPDRRAYILALVPVGISAVQLLVRLFTVNENIAMFADLVCVLLISPSLNRFRFRNILAALTGISVVQAILTAGFYDINPLRFIHHSVLYIIFPYLLASAYTRYDMPVFVKMGVMAALGLAAMNIVVMPLELIMRGGIASLYQLNFSGRSYELIAIQLLAATLAAIGTVRASGLLSASLFVTALLSFSRGAIAVVLSVLAITWRRQLLSFFTIRSLAIMAIIIFGVIIFLSGDFFDAFGKYWIVRLNFLEDGSIYSNIDGFLEGAGRGDIWSIGIEHIEEWTYLGTGVATVAYYVSEATQGIYAFSGYHNLTITILAERGIFIGGLFCLLLLFILKRLVQCRSWLGLVYFVGFLIFSHTTGAEYVLHSSNVRNANVLFFLFLIFLRLTHVNRPRYV